MPRFSGCGGGVVGQNDAIQFEGVLGRGVAFGMVAGRFAGEDISGVGSTSRFPPNLIFEGSAYRLNQFETRLDAVLARFL